jgi:hypothetical protein
VDVDSCLQSWIVGYCLQVMIFTQYLRLIIKVPSERSLDSFGVSRTLQQESWSLQEQAPHRPVTPLAGSVGLTRCPVQGLGKHSADQVKQ